MDVQLQELIEKIKKDGIASAEEEAAKIVAEAEKKAQQIIKDAEEKANGILKNAKQETERMTKASEDAIAQSCRNLVLECRERVNAELKEIIINQTEKAYDKDMLKKLIPETVKAWAANTSVDDITVLLSPADLKALKSSLYTSLKAQISKGLTVGSDSSILGGFRIGSKAENSFYDFSSDEIADLFASYLNPKTAEIMKNVLVTLDGEKAPVKEEKPAAKNEAPKAAAMAKPAAKKAPAKKAPAKAKAKK